MGYNKNLLIEDWEFEAQKDQTYIQEKQIEIENEYWQSLSEAEIVALDLEGQEIDIKNIKPKENANLREMGENSGTGI